MLAGCGSDSSSSSGGGGGGVSVPPISEAQLNSIEDAALYVAVTSGLFGGGDYAPNEDPPDLSGPDMEQDCPGGGTLTLTHGEKTVQTPFGEGEFAYQTMHNEACRHQGGGMRSLSDGFTETGYAATVGVDNHTVLYHAQGDLDSGTPHRAEHDSADTFYRTELLLEHFECRECQGADTYEISQYSETWVSDGQYGYRFQFGESRAAPLTATETVIHYRQHDDDTYVFDYDVEGVVGLNSSVCELGSAHWATTQTLRIEDKPETDAAGEAFHESRIISGEATINEDIHVVFNNGGATITMAGVSQTYDEDELWEAGIPCYERD
ncbi:hypothetical protein CAI21_07795 [Alkalilimnicola ehrlichii]|nr:hypothetical protein [Alkalilimnicola ehrlichii]RFA30095.1 hypothetical protein CAI21_07795 [Alkalilimnicola ehrlichii]